MEAIPSNFFPAEILIVDDKLDNLKLLTTMLTEQHYQVRRAISGEIALQAMQNLQPDLILLDLVLPDMPGVEVLRRLRSDPQTRHIPVIVVSASTRQDDRIEALAAGADDIFFKPYDDQLLMSRVRNLLRLGVYQLDHTSIPSHAAVAATAPIPRRP